MKTRFNVFFLIVGLLITTCLPFNCIISIAWSDSDGGRPSYSLQEIDEKAEEFGNTPFFNSITIADSDYAWHQQVFGESIPVGTITHEKNYVGAREDTGMNAGSENVWAGNDLTVEDRNITVENGVTYIVRMYVHNDNPNGWDAVAENTRVKFNVPNESAKTLKVNGYITSDNASPNGYVDYVNFNSDTPFHLEYISGSALIENRGAVGGSTLDDSIVKAASTDGVLIGYDALDGLMPGGYGYDCYITIKVKVVFDREFRTEIKVRLADSEDKTWHDTIEANVGDKVELQMQYKNKSDSLQENVTIRNVLPKSLQYISGSTILYNGSYPDGATVVSDDIVKDGINIGHYTGYTSKSADDGANAYIRITAEVVEEGLNPGENVLVDWGQAQAGVTKQLVLQDYATVIVNKKEGTRLLDIILITLIGICLFLIALCIRKIYKLQPHK